MPGRVTDYETKQNYEVAPKTLHGVQEVRMMLIQCADQHSRTQVLLGVEVEPGDIRVFPEDTWERLGKPAPWLQDQLDAALGVKVKAKPAPKKRKSKRSVKGDVPLDDAV